ncbi:MAG TPA: type II toxin-antitoxin system VapC family toxin, partial [Allocoleopsis sp.]
MVLEAAKIWAEARQQSRPTSDAKNLDADMIISAHWKLLKQDFPGRYIVVSTTNVKHLSLFTEAQE